MGKTVVGNEAAMAAIMAGENVFISGPGGCVDRDTEFLSPRGWIPISEWDNDLVMTYSANGKAQFLYPEAYIKERCEKMYHLQGQNIDQMLSDDHRVIYKYNGSTYKGVKYPDGLKEITAEELVKRFKKSKRGLGTKFITTFDYSGIGIDMTEGEIRLQVAVMADGRIVKEGKNNYTQMRFSKKRKYDRLIDLCKNFGLPYKDNGAKVCEKYSNNTEYEVIVWPKTDEKYFGGRWYDCSKWQLETIVDEVIFWDGSVSDRCLVSTNHKDTADFIQFAAASLGKRASIKVDKRNKNTNYVVRTTRYSTPTLPKGRKGNVEISEVNTEDGFKYCFTVATGMLVLRRNGKVFVTGNCGKSLMIATLREFFTGSFLFVAPTGIAALNISGTTAHKAFGLTFGITTKEDYRAKSKKPAILMSSDALDAIVFDEISMIRRDKFREIDMKLRHHRKVNKPFGGLQIIVFGDGFQIKPVLKREETAMFRDLHGSEIPFGCDVWEELNFTNAYLPKVHRQQDPEFAGHLNNIRVGKDIGAAVDYFNKHCYGPPLADAVTLTTTNKVADEINEKEFLKIKAEPKEFKALISGEFTERPVSEVMNLKVGLKVMVVVNDTSDKKQQPDYVNGTVGIISKIAHSFVVVNIDGREIPIGKNAWKNIAQVPEEKMVEVKKEVDMPDGTKQTVVVKEKQIVLVDKEIGTFLQFPFKLGYAITGHKAQGLTLGRVNIDLGYGTFTPGQAYVMISRATSKEGLRLMKKLRVKDIIVDQEILAFYKKTFPEFFGD